MSLVDEAVVPALSFALAELEADLEADLELDPAVDRVAWADVVGEVADREVESALELELELESDSDVGRPGDSAVVGRVSPRVVVASEVAGAPVLNIVLSAGVWTVTRVASPVQRLYRLVLG
ncbi:hypothetical protein APSETT445_009575 [Aspergillus pseudonomiae]